MSLGNWMASVFLSNVNVDTTMPEFTTQKMVFLLVVLLYTCITAWTDLRRRKIYNKTTVPMWVAGWIYQAVFFQWDGIVNGLAGFGLGFGLFFVLWMIGSAGGGDVKLIGALGVWLGGPLTLKVILASLVFVVVGTFGLLIVGICRQGWKRTKASYVRPSASTSKSSAIAPPDNKSKRRVMAFAMPVALATWSVLLMFQNQW